MPGSKLLILEMVIPPLIGNPYNGYIKPYEIRLSFPSPTIGNPIPQLAGRIMRHFLLEKHGEFGNDKVSKDHKLRI